MNKIIQEIVNTDKALRSDVNKAKQRRENLTAELAQKKIIIDNEHKHNAEETIAKARKNAEDEIKKTSDEIQRATSEKLDRLNDVYNKDHEKWEREILNSVLKD